MQGKYAPTVAVGALVVVGMAALLGIPLERLLPLAFLLACPLMMLFMHHGGHAGQGHAQQHDAPPTSEQALDERWSRR